MGPFLWAAGSVLRCTPLFPLLPFSRAPLFHPRTKQRGPRSITDESVPTFSRFSLLRPNTSVSVPHSPFVLSREPYVRTNTHSPQRHEARYAYNHGRSSTLSTYFHFAFSLAPVRESRTTISLFPSFDTTGLHGSPLLGAFAGSASSPVPSNLFCFAYGISLSLFPTVVELLLPIQLPVFFTELARLHSNRISSEA